MARTKKKIGVRVFNDDFNEFKFVTEVISNAFGYRITQAHQCTLLIHQNGSYVVKVLDMDQKIYAELYCEHLNKHGIGAELVVM